MSVAMKRDGARIRRQIQESRDTRESRESRRTNRQPLPEADLESSEESPQETMSINSNNAFPSFLDNNTRGPPTQQVNGNGGPMNGMSLSMPMNAGHQMDVNMLYQKVLELSEVLKENREKTQGIIAGAEELAVGFQPLTLVFEGMTDLFCHWLDSSCCQWGHPFPTRSQHRHLRYARPFSPILRHADRLQLPASPNWRND